MVLVTMKEATLLLAMNGIIGRIKIQYQTPRTPFE